MLVDCHGEGQATTASCDKVLLNKMKELEGELAQMGKRSKERWEKFRHDQASSLRRVPSYTCRYVSRRLKTGASLVSVAQVPCL